MTVLIITVMAARWERWEENIWFVKAATQVSPLSPKKRGMKERKALGSGRRGSEKNVQVL